MKKQILLSVLYGMFLVPLFANAQATTTATSTASFITTPSCIIASGANRCTSSLSWTSANAPTVTLADCGGGFYMTTGSGGQTGTVTIPYNSGCYQIRDASTTLIIATVYGTSTCATGTIWNGSMCMTPAVVSTSTTATSTQAINLAYTLCMQPVSLKRDTALVSARSIYTQALAQALATRTTGESAAILLTDPQAKANALQATREAYKTATRNAETALKTAQTNVQTTYTNEVKNCKVIKDTAPVSSSTKKKLEDWKRNHEVKKEAHENFKHALQNLRSEYKNKFNTLKSQWNSGKGNH